MPEQTSRTSELSLPPVVDHIDRHGDRPSATPVTVNQAEDRRDRVRWGPISAGVAVVITVFIVLQLLFFAFGWLDPTKIWSGRKNTDATDITNHRTVSA